MHTTLANSTVNEIHRKIPAWCQNSPFHELGSSVGDDSSPTKREREHWRRLVVPHYREIDYQS